MSRARFLADNDLDDHLINALSRREPAIDFIRARAVGLRTASDPDVLSFAWNNKLIVVSHDVNTMPLHAFARAASGEPMAGLLMVRQNLPIPPILDSLILIWSASEAEEWHGQVRFLPL